VKDATTEAATAVCIWGEKFGYDNQPERCTLLVVSSSIMDLKQQRTGKQNTLYQPLLLSYSHRYQLFINAYHQCDCH